MTSTVPAAPAGYAEAIAAFQGGRDAEARALLERCVQQAPAHVGSRFGLGVALGRLGETARAEECLRAVVALDPRHVHAFVELGRLLSKAGRHDESLEAFRQVLHLDPAHVEALRETARLEGIASRATAGVPSQPTSSARGTLAADLDEDELPTARRAAGAVLLRGHRRLLSHRRLWVAGALLLLLPALGYAERSAESVASAAPGPGQRQALTVGDTASALGYLVLAAALVLVVGAVLNSRLTSYTVRERRVDLTSGVLFRRHRIVWLYDITDVQLHQTPALLLAGTAKLVLHVDEPSGGSKSKPPELVGVAGVTAMRTLQERLQPMVLAERRSMKKSFI